jgi:hypothetical protein
MKECEKRDKREKLEKFLHVWWEKQKERNTLKDLDLGVKMILKWILKKLGVGLLAGVM